DQVADRVEQTVAQLREATNELEKLRAQLVLANVGGLAGSARDINGVGYVGTEAPDGAAATDVRTLAQEIRGRLAVDRPGVVAVTARAGGKASLVVATNAPARDRGLSAAVLVKSALSGRGGGSPELAQGGGAPAGDAATLLVAVEQAIAGPAGPIGHAAG
ncbi:MAG: alanyl-tRNA synthetase, partial [Micromonosporaceae bacterium]|nr:alanyl-tRNA synthetase [Micromonosporaceae bacterium]